MLEKFDNYQLLSKIATGGMAEIYLAKHMNSPVNSMPIAIKKILKQYSSNPALLKMFLSEARIICNINHENIVKIYDFGKYENQYFIAMEYVSGQNLGSIQNKMRQKGIQFPMNLMIEIVLGVLSGLDHAHNTKDKNGVFLNVVHLDMNPNNILISYDGKIKVVDFGIANVNFTKKIKGTLSSVQGTYGYLSPEQCREIEVDRRSDIFSLGVILYEMITNEPLYKDLENDATIFTTILNGTIKPIQELVPEIDPKIAKIVMKALEKDPNKRYSTAQEMKEDLLGVYNLLEFDPGNETLQSFLKKLFPSHYIKMTKVLERAQTEYLMDELFKDIGELEELDQKEKIRLKNIADEIAKNNAKVKLSARKILVFGIIAFITLCTFFSYFIFKSDVEYENVSVFSSPLGAEIFINGEDTGKITPSQLQLEKGKKYIIEFRKDDHIGGMNFTPSEENREVKMVLKKK